MSLITRVAAECPACGNRCETDQFASINADRRPDLRKHILDETLQAVTCDNCEARFRLPPRMTYVDFERGQWIAAQPGEELPRWRESEPVSQDVFDATYGAGSPAQARELGQTMRPRLVFGWSALREKLLCAEHGLDDVRLELLKLAVLRSVQKSPVADDSELRLDGAEARELILGWIRFASGERVNRLKVPRAVYEGIDTATAPWSELGAQLSGHLFVDMNRLLVTT